jgi:transcriptional regulator with XRE-family HTH domain
MTDLDFQTIGKQIRKRRRECGLTQEAIAEQLDVNPSHISNIENGRANPSLTILVKLANLMECSVDFFISHEYSYKDSDTRAQDVDEKILSRLGSCDLATKEKVLKIIELLS